GLGEARHQSALHAAGLLLHEAAHDRHRTGAHARHMMRRARGLGPGQEPRAQPNRETWRHAPTTRERDEFMLNFRLAAALVWPEPQAPTPTPITRERDEFMLNSRLAAALVWPEPQAPSPTPLFSVPRPLPR